MQRLARVGLLAAGVAHDLNNLLTPVLLAVPMLRADMPDGEGRELLALIDRGVRHSADLSRHMLAVARGAEREHHRIDLHAAIGDTASLLREVLPQSIRLVIEAGPGPCCAEGNPTQVHQVLFNLCLNARDAMAGGGVLRIGLENKRLDDAAAAGLPGARPGEFTVIAVRDTGTGIAPGMLSCIWEPFVTTKPSDKGTGLGLSTVRAIVADHQGFVTVETAVGHGTTFRVWLPRSNTEARAGESASVATPGGDRAKLFIVAEDEAFVRHAIAGALNERGHRVFVAANVMEVVTLCARHRGDTIIVIGGLESAVSDYGDIGRHLRELSPGVSIVRAGAVIRRAGLSSTAIVVDPARFESWLTTICDSSVGHDRSA